MSQHASKSIFSHLTALCSLSLVGISLSLCLPTSAFANDYSATPSTEQGFFVHMNKTQILHLPAAASTIVVGNPDIADISVHSPDTIFIIGRGYGQTNLIALDAQGQTIMQANITVKSTNTRLGVRVINIGAGQESYHCAPNCLPTPILGDSPDFIGKYSAIGGAINNLSAGPVSNTASGQVQAALSATEASPPPPQGFEGMGQSIRPPREPGSER